MFDFEKTLLVIDLEVQTLRTAEADAAQKVQELQELLAEASSNNPDSNRQDMSADFFHELLLAEMQSRSIESMRAA